MDPMVKNSAIHDAGLGPDLCGGETIPNPSSRSNLDPPWIQLRSSLGQAWAQLKSGLGSSPNPARTEARICPERWPESGPTWIPDPARDPARNGIRIRDEEERKSPKTCALLRSVRIAMPSHRFSRIANFWGRPVRSSRSAGQKLMRMRLG